MGKSLNLFEGFTPEEIVVLVKAVKHPLYGRSKPPRSEEHRRNLSKALTGRISPLLGKTLSEENREKLLKAHLGKTQSWATRIKISEALVGRPKGPMSEEHKKKLSKARMRQPEPMLGKTHSEETKRKISQAQMGKKHSEETRRRNSESNKRRWREMSEEERVKWVKNWRPRFQEPTIPELEVKAYLDSRFPGEWKYNGSGPGITIIGGKRPDFVNINGKKEVIEVFGYYWHADREEQERITHYAKYGFKCTVIWEFDTCPEALDKILVFKEVR